MKKQKDSSGGTLSLHMIVFWSTIALWSVVLVVYLAI